MSRTIIAIGGGEIKNLETLTIDKKIIELTHKKRPRTLFIPTASHDAFGYWETFQKVYGKKLGCITDVLFLTKNKLTKKQIQQKILNSDLIYVGGGSTLYMMQIWRKLGVDKILKKAWEKGIVLSGLSAGSICWFKAGLSDSIKNKFIKVRGLGFIDAINNPHYHQDKGRISKFKILMNKEKNGEIGIGMDNNSAIIFQDNKEEVIRSDKKAKIYRYFKENDKVKIVVE